MWVMGAVATTGALVIALMAIYQALFKGWGKKVGNDFRFHLWVYQAMRAWEREGNPRPVNQTMTEREKLETSAGELIYFAEEHGYVLTITTEPMHPLAMGNSYMAYEVREARRTYSNPSK